MHGILTYMAVIIGGALGGISRYMLILFVPHHEWLGVLLANVSGCFLMGWAVQALNTRKRVPSFVKKGTTVGFIGGYTTMSTFIADFFSFMTENWLLALVYVFSSVCGGILLAWLGMVVGKKVAVC
ncbi:fluoride efflux transporter FluC [Shouchella lehensis]|uniref:Fluoride-specific ion channel FluC n=1 Tax=Shouchella lehensis TaxID=300825 RepID=A0A4Y7WSK2_9BACI|nr:CrcB family protein [Shouchella lehensis]MBG9783544.1 hypothetical protein [Shouchella lehensis]TES51468.1 CrcB family protein [Shouchella lehensis]